MNQSPFEFKSSLPVHPKDNTINIKNMDLCEECKAKIIDSFIKAYIGERHNETNT